MVSLKRIKNKEDLIDVLNFLWEDVNTYKFLKPEKTNNVNNILSKLINELEG